MFGVGVHQSQTKLFRIDPVSRVPILIGVPFLDGYDVPLDISFRPIDENVSDATNALLYLLSGNGNDVRLYTLDISTAAASLVGDVSSQPLDGFAFAIDACNRAFLVVRDADDLKILQLSLDDASTVAEKMLCVKGFLALRIAEPALASMTFDRCANVLYALLYDTNDEAERSEQYLMKVDWKNGVAHLVGATSGGLRGLTAEARTFGLCRAI